jgi:hypothetical protein
MPINSASRQFAAGRANRRVESTLSWEGRSLPEVPARRVQAAGFAPQGSDSALR